MLFFLVILITQLIRPTMCWCFFYLNISRLKRFTDCLLSKMIVSLFQHHILIKGCGYILSVTIIFVQIPLCPYVYIIKTNENKNI